jgi:hypothetical protein
MPLSAGGGAGSWAGLEDARARGGDTRWEVAGDPDVVGPAPEYLCWAARGGARPEWSLDVISSCLLAQLKSHLFLGAKMSADARVLHLWGCRP